MLDCRGSKTSALDKEGEGTGEEEWSEKVVVGDCPSLPTCGEDFHPKKDVSFAPGDLERLLVGEVDPEESNESSVKDLGMRSMPSSCTVIAGG